MANGFVTSSPGARHGDTVQAVDQYDEYAQKFVCPGSGSVSISEIGAWVQRNAVETAYLAMCIYTHDAVNDCPEALVTNGASGAKTISSSGLLKISHTFATQPVLTGGNTYWLILKLNNGTPPSFDLFATGGTTAQRASTSPPFGTGDVWHTHTDQTYDMGIYAVYPAAGDISISVSENIVF